MPKRATPEETNVDPVRSRLAAAAAAPTRPQAKQPPPEEEEPEPPSKGREAGVSPARKARPSQPQAMTVNRKILVTQGEAERMQEMTDAISKAFGSKVTYSQISRVLWALVVGAEDAIRTTRQRVEPPPIPLRGDYVAMAEYETALADFLTVALRKGLSSR